MTKSYIITSGSYSDYSIDRVFSTKEKADKYVNWKNQFNNFCGDYETEEWEMDESWNKKEIVTIIQMERDGNVRRKYLEEYTEYNLGFIGHYKPCGEKGWIFMWGVKTTDEKSAVKIVNEKRTYAISNNAWEHKETMKRLFRDGGLTNSPVRDCKPSKKER